MLIVEGPDGGGKTTLIRQLQEAFDIPVAPRVVTKDTKAMLNLRTWVDDNLDKGFQNMIFDRYRLISETIYGPILRDKAQPGFDDLVWITPRMKRLYELRPTIIYCIPPLETVIKNITSDPDNKVVASKIEAIYSAYVARAALDYTFSPGIVKIWNYKTSPSIDGKPIWFNAIHEYMTHRLGEKA